MRLAGNQLRDVITAADSPTDEPGELEVSAHVVAVVLSRDSLKPGSCIIPERRR